jgi:hypothetical protein
VLPLLGYHKGKGVKPKPKKYILPIDKNMPAMADNTVFVAHFVRPNRLTPTSQTPKPLVVRCGQGKEEKDV